jgi:DNA-directed RNA polymerase subunit RPC12/RpoP
MIRYEDDCVGCPQGCVHCGRDHSPHYYCDECGDEFSPDELYDVDDRMLCAECALDTFKKISNL